MSLIFGIFVFCERLKYHAQLGRAWMKFFWNLLTWSMLMSSLKRYFKRRSLLTWYKINVKMHVVGPGTFA